MCTVTLGNFKLTALDNSPTIAFCTARKIFACRPCHYFTHCRKYYLRNRCIFFKDSIRHFISQNDKALESSQNYVSAMICITAVHAKSTYSGGLLWHNFPATLSDSRSDTSKLRRRHADSTILYCRVTMLPSL